MKKYGLDKIIAATIISGMIVGCAAPKYTGGNRITSRDYAKPVTTIYEEQKRSKADPKTVDDLLSDVDLLGSQIDQTICISPYKSYIDAINTDVKQRDYERVERRIKALANTLDRKDDACSKQLYQSVTNFTYRRYEFVGSRYRITEKASKEPIQYVGTAMSIAYSILVAPVQILFGEANRVGKEIHKPVDRQRRKVQDPYYNVIEVNPYRGTQKNIGKISVD